MWVNQSVTYVGELDHQGNQAVSACFCKDLVKKAGRDGLVTLVRIYDSIKMYKVHSEEFLELFLCA